MMQGSSSSQGGALALDPAVQIQDIRLFESSLTIGYIATLQTNERNLATSVNSLRQLRWRYWCVVGLLFASSIYWTWRLREKLTDTTPRAPQETMRLWFAWALLGIAPTIVFFAFVYQSTVITPNRFVERLNKSLAHYHVAYSAETGRLLRTAKPEVEHTLRQPVRLKSQFRPRRKNS